MTISRRRVAAYLADGLTADRSRRLQVAAAWLSTSAKRTQTTQLARDVASVLAERSYITGTVTTARPITSETLEAIGDVIRTKTGATQLELRSNVDPELLGGLTITLPDTELDGSLSTKLKTFVTEMSQ